MFSRLRFHLLIALSSSAFVSARSLNDSATLANGDYLVARDLGEPLGFPCCRPLYLDGIDGLVFADAEVKPQIALRHDTRSAMDLIHLNVFPSNYPHTCSNCCAIALGPDKLDLDPVLLVASVISQE